MKQETKNWLVAAGALVLIGVLMMVAALAKGDWSFSALGGAAHENETAEIREGFQSITIRSDTEDIVFTPSDNGGCRVVFDEPDYVEHTASVRDGALSIETVDTRKWYDSLFSYANARITVYLPEGMYASLTIEEDTGDVTIPQGFMFADVDITASTGDVSCAASAAGAIRISASTGDIRLEELSAGTMALSVSTGRIEARSVSCAGRFDLTVSTGKTVLRDIVCGELASRGSTGDISMENVLSSGTISIVRSTGDVRLERCDAAALEIQTDTGDVTGSLLSEKVFLTQTDTGSVRVPDSTAGGTCRISTDTGDITMGLH